MQMSANLFFGADQLCIAGLDGLGRVSGFLTVLKAGVPAVPVCLY